MFTATIIVVVRLLLLLLQLLLVVVVLYLIKLHKCSFSDKGTWKQRQRNILFLLAFYFQNQINITINGMTIAFFQ